MAKAAPAFALDPPRNRIEPGSKCRLAPLLPVKRDREPVRAPVPTMAEDFSRLQSRGWWGGAVGG